MKYLEFIWAEGMPADDELKTMQRELPAYITEMDSRGMRYFGRELDLPQTASTVRVRGGETLVTDGPFAETKEFLAGFDLLECADRDEAIGVAAKCPISWFQTLEVRPFTDGLLVSEKASAFGRSEDGGATPYLLAIWKDAAETVSPGDQGAPDEDDAWRQDAESRGVQVFGHPLQGPGTAATVRVRDGKTQVGDGPLTLASQFVASIDVVTCTDRQQAIELAAAHPAARYHAIEVRPFYQE